MAFTAHLSSRSTCVLPSLKPVGSVTVDQRIKACKTDNKSSTSGRSEVHLYSIALPVFTLASGGTGLQGALTSLLQPGVEYTKTLNLPDWLIHWGHPGNMAVVLFAMGLYGSGYLGWQIRTSGDTAMVAKAKALHPKVAGGMAVFFAIGALGGLTSLLVQGKPILQSPHATTGLVGLALLAVQAMLPLLFDDEPGLRTIHAVLGSGILALFLVHGALGLNLGLSI